MNVRPLRIRDIEVSPPVLPAPMSGYTDRAYRTILREWDAPVVYTEMVSSEGLARNKEKSWRTLNIEGEQGLLVVQLFGAQPQVMAEAARMVADKGINIIDINAGCPIEKVVRTGSGAALLKEPDRLLKIVRAVRTAINIPLTVKIRSGWDESSILVPELARNLEAEGVDAIYLHPRTHKQGFTGKADWQLIAGSKEAIGIPLIGNGDVKNPLDAGKLLEQTGCDAVMIGRAILGNPWVIKHTVNYLKAGASSLPPNLSPALDERFQVILRHTMLAVKFDGKKQGMVNIKRHMIHYLKGFPGARPLRTRALQVTDVNELKELFEAFLTSGTIEF